MVTISYVIKFYNASDTMYHVLISDLIIEEMGEEQIKIITLYGEIT